MFNVLLIYKILRHFVPQNDSVVFTEKDFVYDLSSPGRKSGAHEDVKKTFFEPCRQAGKTTSLEKQSEDIED